MSDKHIEVYESGGNIFADLGLPDAEAHFLKAQIVAELYRLTAERKLTQAKAGALMGISQPEVSRLFKGNFREYSVDRLMAFLTTFDRDVEIVSRPRPKAKDGQRGHITFKPVAAREMQEVAAENGGDLSHLRREKKTRVNGSRTAAVRGSARA